MAQNQSEGSKRVKEYSVVDLSGDSVILLCYFSDYLSESCTFSGKIFFGVPKRFS